MYDYCVFLLFHYNSIPLDIDVLACFTTKTKCDKDKSPSEQSEDIIDRIWASALVGLKASWFRCFGGRLRRKRSQSTPTCARRGGCALSGSAWDEVQDA